MIVVRLLHSFLFATLVLSLACSQQNAPDDIVSKYVETLGGRSKLGAVQSMKLTGKYITSGEERPLTIYKSRPNLFRLEVLIDGEKLIRAYDGKQAWEFYAPRSAEARVIEDLRTKSFVERNADFYGGLVDYQEKGNSVELAGKQVIDGHETFLLQVSDQSGKVENWYLKSSDYTLLQRTSKLPHPYDPSEEDITQVFFYMDYRPADGLLVPRYIEREDMQYVWEHEIETVEINPKIEPGLFEMSSRS